MSVCHGDRARVLQRVHDAKQRLDAALRQPPEDPAAIERLRRELLGASEALARLPDCSE